jgi:hypothetical protein
MLEFAELFSTVDEFKLGWVIPKDCCRCWSLKEEEEEGKGGGIP